MTPWGCFLFCQVGDDIVYLTGSGVRLKRNCIVLSAITGRQEVHNRWLWLLLLALQVILYYKNPQVVILPGGSADKESACNAGDLGLIPGLGRSPGEGNGCPLQYPGLENSMDCIVHGAAKSQTQLSNFHFTSLQLVINHMLRGCHRAAVPKHFGTRDWSCGRQFFP